MALQLKKRNYKFHLAATGALVLGAGFLLVKTYPHLMSCFTTKGKEEEDDNTPVELQAETKDDENNSTLESQSADVSLVDVAEWSDENLRSFLLEVSIHQLKIISENTNGNRKKSVLLPTLITISLFPLLNQFRKAFNINFNVILTMRIFLVRFLLLLKGVFN